MQRSAQKRFSELLKAALATPTRSTVQLEGFHRAGVLVPLIIRQEGTPLLLLTKRTEQVETHKGQVSFPGGMVDEGDEDIVQTALRETREELGIDSSRIEVAGMLDDLATPSGFVITPVVGIMQDLPPLKPNPQEVIETFTVGFEFFQEPANGWTEVREFRGEQREVWFFQCGNHTVWGATASIIRALVTRLQRSADLPPDDAESRGQTANA